MKHFVLISVLACAALAPQAHAAKTGSDALDVSKVVAQQQQIRQDVIASGGKYRGLSPDKQSELLRRQNTLLQMLEGKETAADLTETQRIEAFNTLEWIEATLNDDHGEKMVCTRERTVGSNRVTRVCRTEAQMLAERERAREDMLRNQSRFQTRR